MLAHCSVINAEIRQIAMTKPGAKPGPRPDRRSDLKNVIEPPDGPFKASCRRTTRRYLKLSFTVLAKYRSAKLTFTSTTPLLINARGSRALIWSVPSKVGCSPTYSTGQSTPPIVTFVFDSVPNCRQPEPNKVSTTNSVSGPRS